MHARKANMPVEQANLVPRVLPLSDRKDPRKRGWEQTRLIESKMKLFVTLFSREFAAFKSIQNLRPLAFNNGLA